MQSQALARSQVLEFGRMLSKAPLCDPHEHAPRAKRLTTHSATLFSPYKFTVCAVPLVDTKGQGKSHRNENAYENGKRKLKNKKHTAHTTIEFGCWCEHYRGHERQKKK